MVQTVAMFASLKFDIHFWKWVHGEEYTALCFLLTPVAL